MATSYSAIPTTPATGLPSIPLAYRLLLLYIEPVMAFNGAVLCIFNPRLFLNTFSPNLSYAPSNQIVYDQLAATYALFAFNQAIVLRVSKDIRVWKAIVAGILLCDCIHVWAGWKVMVQDGNTMPQGWRPEDWVAVLALAVPMALRSGLLFGVGVGKTGDNGIGKLQGNGKNIYKNNALSEKTR
ncbi:hypothetical protein CC80DRAFT_257221 [Byssothecium circinans]|uniref:DUF7704 domain-containing protein n=1 Tax=Byssothecium circinans TaxID=147558 RepID=A0A6A5T9H3_9PLEO|nr:hypothetical protein CC80DRAFT_257221 [Byssothecium circinans]